MALNRLCVHTLTELAVLICMLMSASDISSEGAASSMPSTRVWIKGGGAGKNSTQPLNVLKSHLHPSELCFHSHGVRQVMGCRQDGGRRTGGEMEEGEGGMAHKTSPDTFLRFSQNFELKSPQICERASACQDNQVTGVAGCLHRCVWDQISIYRLRCAITARRQTHSA